MNNEQSEALLPRRTSGLNGASLLFSPLITQTLLPLLPVAMNPAASIALMWSCVMFRSGWCLPDLRKLYGLLTQ